MYLETVQNEIIKKGGKNMNKRKLVAIMYEHGDTQQSLAEAMGISLQRFNAKINETGGAEFTQSEIRFIKERYNLTSEEVEEIFFTYDVS